MLSINLNDVGKFFRPAFLILSRPFGFASPGLVASRPSLQISCQ